VQKIDGTECKIKIDQATLDEVDRIAKRCGLTRAEMVRNMLSISSDLFRTYESVGMVKLFEVKERLFKTVNRSVGQQALFSD